ncbi:MAG: hypothetical protein J0L75_04490 [Spirochaetes bacterium]|nr:hypothetical protein [Spirochaetota bacterium]
MAKSTNARGDYDQSSLLALQARDKMEAVIAWQGVLPFAAMADRWSQTARTELSLALPEGVGALRSPDHFGAPVFSNLVKAVAFFEKGSAEFSNAETQWGAIVYSNALEACIGSFSNSAGSARLARAARERSSNGSISRESSSVVRPAYYVVRNNPSDRDCFWKIAKNPSIYNDPYAWRVIYLANRAFLQNPENPDLIQPGMRFAIPSLHGESRNGVHDSGQ